MKKITIRIAMMITVVLMLVSAPLNAQIYIMDEEFEGHDRTGYTDIDWGTFVPVQGQDADQYLPLGDGVLALGLLGGAYLLSKRKKRE